MLLQCSAAVVQHASSPIVMQYHEHAVLALAFEPAPEIVQSVVRRDIAAHALASERLDTNVHAGVATEAVKALDDIL